MTRSRFGALAAAAVTSMLGTAAIAASEKANGDAKACYRPSCGKSVKGHEGSCGGTKVDDITDQKTCETAGGAWTTKTAAEKSAH